MVEPRHRKEVRNEHIFRVVCFESAVCGPCVDARLRRGRSTVVLAKDLPTRPVSARITLLIGCGLPEILTALILVCSLALIPDLREHSRDNAVHVLQVPEEFALPAICAMRSQALCRSLSQGSVQPTKMICRTTSVEWIAAFQIINLCLTKRPATGSGKAMGRSMIGIADRQRTPATARRRDQGI